MSLLQAAPPGLIIMIEMRMGGHFVMFQMRRVTLVTFMALIEMIIMMVAVEC